MTETIKIETSCRYEEALKKDETLFYEDGFYYKDKNKDILVGISPDFFNKIPGTNKTTIKIPSSVREINDGAFIGISIKRADLLIPNTVEQIGDSAFHMFYCRKIKFEDGLKSLPDSAFHACLVKNYELPSSVKRIGNFCFSGASSVKNIDLSHVEEIGICAFNGCQFESLVLNEIKSIGHTAFSNSALKNIEINAKNDFIIMPKTFSGCRHLEKVTMKNVVEIGEEAFSFTDHLNSINLSDNPIRKIDYLAFCSSGLTELTLPSDIKRIDNSAFSTCRNLVHVSIPESVTSKDGISLGSSIFEDTAVTELTIPESVRSMEQRCLESMKNLETLTVNADVDRIPPSFADNCIKLKNITLNPKINYLCELAFHNTAFTEVSSAFKNIRLFGRLCFKECNNLEKVFINEKAVVEDLAFAMCDHLRLAVFLGDNISPGAFDRASNKVHDGLTLIAPNILSSTASILRNKSITTGTDIKVLDKTDKDTIDELLGVVPFRVLATINKGY